MSAVDLDPDDEPRPRCSFCGGPASGPGPARLIVRSNDRRASVCGDCIATHAKLLEDANERTRPTGD